MRHGKLIVLLALACMSGVWGPALAGDTQAEKRRVDSKQESDQQRRARLRLQRNQRILNREELEATMAPQLEAIKDCYQKHTASEKKATGELQIGMLIRPKGTIQSLWTRSPGVHGKSLDTCIRDLSVAWRFPEKPGFTNAIIPYYFQKTRGKGTGPLESCWSASGCPKAKADKNVKKKARP